MDLTFGEQVKIVLRRKGMTIKELAELIEAQTGKKMSRQNLTQRLRRDNFQEQDMRTIAAILECPFELNILGNEEEEEQAMEQLSLQFEQEPEEVVAKAEAEPKEEVDEKEEAAAQEEVAAEEAVVEEPEIVEEESVFDFTSIAQEEEHPESDVLVGDLIDMTEEPVAEPTEDQQHDTFIKELLDEVDAIESETQKRSKEREEHVEQFEKEKTEKKGGWMSRLFSRRKDKKENRPVEETREAPTGEPEGGAEYPEVMEQAVVAAEDRYADEPPVFATAEEEVNAAEYAQEYVPSAEEAYGEQDASAEGAYGEYAATEGAYQEQAPAEREVYAESAQEEVIAEAVPEPEEEEDLEIGEVNPYTGREYATNSVRMHPKRIGYVQVYDRKDHKWTDMTEWAFLGYQERKKVLLGKDYEPPIYLD